MRIINTFEKDEDDALILLESFNLENASEQEMKELITHLRNQFKTRYQYLVGEWRNAKRAKSTRNGQFISNKEVIDYLK
ncbi:MAG: hypothetical protein RBR15_11650 [Sphaerochaeta sp.]|nr:hypothetical protein [Sphaerochaeta sp.]